MSINYSRNLYVEKNVSKIKKVRSFVVPGKKKMIKVWDNKFIILLASGYP